ncbi:MAG TPA: hypothetical protein PK715_11335, partial [Chitinophagales bacterium]|nr:hypothetical protein [Chitinophagales bacterium]
LSLSQKINNQLLKMVKQLFYIFVISVFTGLSACNSKAPTAAKSEKPEETITVNGKTYQVADIYNMKEEQLKGFMRDVLDDKLPDNYPVPDYITNATSVKEMYNTFYERYPYFAFQQDAALRTEVSFRPQMYVDMIRENKILRNKVEELDKATTPK